jgi:flagellar motor protein MotB
MTDNTGFAATGERAAAITATARSLLDQMVLARATELARAGRYGEAEKVLSADGAETEYAPAALDLLARMRAQQGYLADAEKLWTRAAQLDPSNIAYLSALRRAAALQQSSSRRWVVVVIPLVVCVVVGALAWMWWASWRPAKPLLSTVAPPASAQVSSPPGRPAPSPQPTTATQSSEQAAVPPVEKSINVAGVTLTEDSGVLLVSFDDGLFERGLKLKPDARQRLTELGRQLKPYVATSAVEIAGMTDGLPVARNSRYPDNASLGMERARIVYDFLRFASGLKSQIFTLTSNHERSISLLDNTPVNRARNRTVILRIGTR